MVWFGISDTATLSPSEIHYILSLWDALLIDTPAISYKKVYPSKVALWNWGVYPMWETFNRTDPSEEQRGELK